MSYLQIKRFVDEQVLILNTPLQIDDSIKQLIYEEHLSQSHIQSILFKCNLLLKRHNRLKFNKQVVHQIVQQVDKAERANLIEVNESLTKISRLAQPVMIDNFVGSGRLEDRVRVLKNLSDLLPEGRYLFALQGDSDDDDDEIEDEDQEHGSETKKSSGLPDMEKDEDAGLDSRNIEGDALVRDNEELVQSAENKETTKTYLKAVREEMRGHINAHKGYREELRQQYDDLRSRFADLNEDLIYKMEKSAYIKELNQRLDLSGGGVASNCSDSEGGEDEDSGCEEGTDMSINKLGPQMSRFKVLVEKLEFALSS